MKPTIGIGTTIQMGNILGTVKFIENDGVLIEISGRLQKFSFKEVEGLVSK